MYPIDNDFQLNQIIIKIFTNIIFIFTDTYKTMGHNKKLPNSKTHQKNYVSSRFI